MPDKLILDGISDINALAQICWNITETKGFHTSGQTFGDKMMLAVSELSEALEEYRAGHKTCEIYFVTDKQGNRKPEGIPVEIIDCIIRLFDDCVEFGIDVEQVLKLKMQYNASRPHLHGGKVM